MKIEEKRRFPRLDVKIPVAYRIRGRPELNNALSSNLSIRGINFKAADFIPPQTLMAININILSHSVNPMGKVIWSSPIAHSDQFRVGVGFVELDISEQDLLIDFINNELKKL